MKAEKSKPRILIVEDNPSFAKTLKYFLNGVYEVFIAANGEEAIETCHARKPHVALIDILLPGNLSGFDVLSNFSESSPSTVNVMVTCLDDGRNAAKAFKRGAFDYIPKPTSEEEILDAVGCALGRSGFNADRIHRSDLLNEYPEIVGNAPALLACLLLVERFAPTDLSVLIQGETGTGKELIARALHRHSPYSSGPFEAVNCGAVGKTLFLSDLFGHERGAFTGADATRRGAFDRAVGGTLFLDEVSELPPEGQAALLRVLEEKEYLPLGGSEYISWHGRLLFATNRDIEGLVSAGAFRADLFHRIDEPKIKLPPLRERRGDIGPLARHFLKKHGLEKGKTDFGPGVLGLLLSSDCPGNVRQLEAAVRRAVAFSQDSTVNIGDFSSIVTSKKISRGSLRQTTISLRDLSGEQKMRMLSAALRRSGGKLRAAARSLGIDHAYFHRLCKKLKINCRDYFE